MKKLILIFIVAVSFVLRIYKLDVRPLGFTWDEAALGYNAYSLLKTGRDEYAEILPTVFKSFGDYKPSAYVYFAVPSVAVFGLNEFSTRFPSALIGTLLVVAIYVLVTILFSTRYALFATCLLAINPWAIHFSRGAWEVNLYLLLIVIGAISFLKKRYMITALFFGLSLFAYQGAKLFTPIMVTLLIAFYRPQFKKLVVPAIVGLVLILPILFGLTTQSGRLRVFSAFSYVRSQEQFEPNIFFHNNVLDQVRGLGERYLNYFSPRFLFFQGDWTNLRHSLIYYGYFHLPEILTISLGTIFILRSRIFSLPSKLILSWLLLAPLPAALSRDLVTGVRSLQMMIPLVVISGLGLASIQNKFVRGVVVCCLMFSFVGYLDLYYIHTPTFGQAQWLYPYTPAFKSVISEMDNYEKIVFTDKLGQPYIFALFHTKYDPATYQSQSKLVESASGDVGHVEGFGKFEFRPIYWPDDRTQAATLFVGDFYELPEKDLGDENMELISEVRLPDNLNGLRTVGVR